MMALGEVLETLELLSGPVTGHQVGDFLASEGLEVKVERVEEEGGATDFLRIDVPGTEGRARGGTAPTTGIVGRLGGIGARPGVRGFVSDGDGAVAAIAAATRLARMSRSGDRLEGDVIVATHVCPHAPIIPHEPVPFMGSPVAMATMNRLEVLPEMEAVLAIDTTKGNQILNWKGIAFTPTVLAGWILPVAPDLVEVYQHVVGEPARVLPLSMYDITPYGNGLYHVNSILQPAVTSAAPVVGVAITAVTAVPGSATNASHPVDIALATSFVLEVAYRHGSGRLALYDEAEHHIALEQYGGMEHLQR